MFETTKQQELNQQFISSSETHQINRFSGNGNQSSPEESSSISSSDEDGEEEDHVNLKKTRDSTEPIFVKVMNIKTHVIKYK